MHNILPVSNLTEFFPFSETIDIIILYYLLCGFYTQRIQIYAIDKSFKLKIQINL